ncbi:Hypothetical protein D9617_12g037800 [Elsinoe fawcettii]|nr:Hypothetical protein D9617_12g037800 [Elsinoe fawcettii]
MSQEPLFVLPRSSSSLQSPPTWISAPSESSFTSHFGQILPAAEYITTPSGPFAYYSFPPSTPSPSAPRVLLLHGVQTPAIGLVPLITALRTSLPNAHFVTQDWYGHGLSSTPVQPHEPSLFTGQIDTLLNHLKWPCAHFVGFSFGCSVAVSFTASHPAKVLSLSLVAPAGLMRSADWGEKANAILAGSQGEEAARDWILDFLEGGKLVVLDDWKERVARGEVVAEAVREWQMREHEGHVASVVGIFRDGGVADRHEVFKQVAGTGVKSIAVLGGDDEVCTKEDVEQVGFGNVKVIEGVGHGVVRQRATEVAYYIVEFWRAIGI